MSNVNPQIENGFTKIATELLEALPRIRISGEAMQVFLLIIRKTYGFNKKSDNIPLSQFVLGTGLSKVAICKAIKKLCVMNLIFITKKDNGDITNYKINKHYDTWIPLPKKVTLPKKVITITKKGNSVTKKDTLNIQLSKYNTKENISSQRKKKSAASELALFNIKDKREFKILFKNLYQYWYSSGIVQKKHIPTKKMVASYRVLYKRKISVQHCVQNFIYLYNAKIWHKKYNLTEFLKYGYQYFDLTLEECIEKYDKTGRLKNGQ